MYLLITRTFPPELGGMQNLMWGLARSLAKLNLIKVFADYHENHEEFDNSVSFSIERVSGIKLIRKYRKSYLINDYLENNKNVECLIADHWKSLELIKTNKKKICLIHSKEINHPKGSGLNKKVFRHGLNEKYYFENGGREFLHKKFGLNIDRILKKI